MREARSEDLVRSISARLYISENMTILSDSLRYRSESVSVEVYPVSKGCPCITRKGSLARRLSERKIS